MKSTLFMALVGAVIVFAGCGPAQEIAPEFRGKLGESCESRNQCEKGLACISGICQQENYDISARSKQCDYIDCRTTEDCCRDFYEPSYCDDYKDACDAGDTFSCDQWDENCQCVQTCVDEQCIIEENCTSDDDCFGNVCDTASGNCVQCIGNDDCYNEGETCVDNVCKEPCVTNDDCPVLYTCTNGDCVETGCADDLTCVYLTGDKRATCTDTLCVIPCEADGECGNFEICEGGKCVDIGCDNDEQCKARIPQGTGLISVCREPV